MKPDKPHGDFYPGLFQSRNARYSQRHPFTYFSSREYFSRVRHIPREKSNIEKVWELRNVKFEEIGKATVSRAH